MAKGAYIGVDGVARKIKKGYIGVDGVARRIKKAYIGVGGVARPCWASGELEYYGTTTGLSVARMNLAATTVGNYALFGGGMDTEDCVTTVDAYSSSLTKASVSGIKTSRDELAATTVGNYALFGGGYTYEDISDDEAVKTVTAYDASLTRSNASDLRYATDAHSAATVGSYALFAGGEEDTNTALAYVTSYNASLTRGSPTSLSVARYSMGAASVGNYALFGGGCDDNADSVATVDAYNKSLTRSTPTVLSAPRDTLAATTVGNYALFGGGNCWESNEDLGPSKVVDAYNASLTRSTPTSLRYTAYALAAAAVGKYALFAGGTTDSYDGTNRSACTAYDSSLVRSAPSSLKAARHSFAATTVGTYALFAGGETSNNVYSSVVDVYTADE